MHINMEQNIFEELQLKKQKMITILSKAEEFGWINEREKNDYLSKIENDVLTIGVIGQMKAGKSTFLNAFVFEDNILPAATTPMTAALSVITYGPEKKVEAEFYNAEEWAEQKRTASLPIDPSTDELMKSKIQAAQELMEKSVKLGASLNDLLGKKQSASIDQLVDYVGADGKYVSITKSVTIYYPKEYLKGVNIVDTPGFNDPIVSREERTKSFLKKADVVLLMLYAGRPFDATDRGILFKNVGECGIGKVLLGINKYDIPYENGETEDEIRSYVKNEIAKASRAMGDEQLNDILRDTEPIPLSAEMALLSELPLEKIDTIDNFAHAWKRACDTFEISSQREMRQKSHLDELISAVRQVIEKEKNTILFKKPINAILARGNNIKSRCDEELFAVKNEIELLQVPDEELEERESKLSKVTRRLNKKIDGLGEDLGYTFNEIIRRGSDDLEDAVDSTCRKLDAIVDAWGLFNSEEKLITDLDKELNFLVSRKMKRLCSDISRDAKLKVKHTLDEFFSDAEEQLTRLSASDFDPRHFVKNVSNKFSFDNDDKTLFTFTDDNENEDYGWGDLAVDVGVTFLNGVTWGVAGKIGNFLTHGDNVIEYHKKITEISSSFDANPYLRKILSSKDKVIDEVKKAFIDELLSPLQTQLDEVRQEGINKEQKLEDAKSKIGALQEHIKVLNSQISQIQDMII